MNRNIWMIDDEKDKVDHLEFIVDSLNKDNEIMRNEIVFQDGFEGNADEAHNNSTRLIEALNDKDGIYLVDLKMSDHTDTAIGILNSIKEKSESEHQQIVAIKEKFDHLARKELKNSELLEDYDLATTMLSICTIRKKPVIIVSSKGDAIRNIATLLAEGDFTKEDIGNFHIFNEPWPPRVLKDDEKGRKEILFKNLIKRIKEVALQSTYIGWEQFLAKVINFSHEECEKSSLLLKNFLRLEADTFKKYFGNPAEPGKLSSFTAEALKSIAVARDNVELHAGWLIGLGIFRGLPGFMELDWEKIWRPQDYTKLEKNTYPLTEIQTEKRRSESLKKFCLMCEKLFKHQDNENKCVLKTVELHRTKMVFYLNIPFNELKEKLVYVLNEILPIIPKGSSSQVTSERLKHLTSTSIRSFRLCSIITEDNLEDIWDKKARMKVVESPDGYTEVIFGVDE